MTRERWGDVQLDLSAALMDTVDDLGPGREIRITRDQGGAVHVTAPDGRLARALQAAYEAERALQPEGVAP